jgi:hypothetical protein
MLGQLIITSAVIVIVVTVAIITATMTITVSAVNVLAWRVHGQRKTVRAKSQRTVRANLAACGHTSSVSQTMLANICSSGKPFLSQRNGFPSNPSRKRSYLAKAASRISTNRY